MAIRKGRKAILIYAVVIPGPNLLTLRKPDRLCLDSMLLSLDKLDSFPQETQSGHLSKLVISFSHRSISLSFIRQRAQSLGKFVGDLSSNIKDITVIIVPYNSPASLLKAYKTLYRASFHSHNNASRAKAEIIITIFQGKTPL